MDDEGALLASVVAATMARIRAQQDAADHLSRRRRAIWRMHHELGLSAAEISGLVRDALRDGGLSAQDLMDLGVGYESVVKIIKGSRPEV